MNDFSPEFQGSTFLNFDLYIFITSKKKKNFIFLVANKQVELAVNFWFMKITCPLKQK